VVNVSWDDAPAFARGTAESGCRRRRNWERACRGPPMTQVSVGGFQSDGEAGVYGLDNGAVDVCTKEKNYFGLCDIIGNVWEWTTTGMRAITTRRPRTTIRRGRRRGGIGWCAGGRGLIHGHVSHVLV